MEDEEKERQIKAMEDIFHSYSLELDDSGQDWIDNEGFYYEYARRLANAGFHKDN